MTASRSPDAQAVFEALLFLRAAESHEVAARSGLPRDRAVAALNELARETPPGANQDANGLWLPGPPLRAPGRAR